MLEHFEPGVRALYKRNPNYWKTGRPYFDSVEVLSIIDNAARTSALKTGEIHLMDRCDLKTVHLLAKMPGISVKEVTGNAHYTIPMRTDMAPFDNNDLRLALKYTLDREALLKTVLRGHGIVGNDHPIGPANQYYAKELPTRKFDPEKAKFHLKKAGMSNLKVDLSAADAAFDGAVDAAVLYKEHAAKSGIDIKVIREPNDGYWSNVWMKKGWSMCYWGGRPTEDWMFATAYAEGASWNDTFWKHAGFNKLLVEARSELDPAKRREMYVELQRIVRDEGGTVVPLFNNFVFAATDKLKHGTIQGNWAQDGHKLYERWWFEA
jgi:peptide/nickel transport system substrate-binding protein